MNFEKVREHLIGIPFINPRNAKKLYNFIIENDIRNVLELGIAHGTASCYIAAALDEKKEGELVCVDLLEAKDLFNPSIEELLDKTKLGKNVKIFREKTGYNWFLRNEIKANTDNYVCNPKYDLCIIDGPKNWTIDGAAFFMVDKLLKDEGWIIFDDYSWTYGSEDKRGYDSTDGIEHKSLSDEELNTPQIREVFQLLVMQHPNYSNFKIHGEGDWAWAQKATDAGKKKVTVEYNVTYKDVFSRIFRILKKVYRTS